MDSMDAWYDEFLESAPFVPESDLMAYEPSTLDTIMDLGTEPQVDMSIFDTSLPPQDEPLNWDQLLWDAQPTAYQADPFRPGHGQADLMFPAMQHLDSTLEPWQAGESVNPFDNIEADLLARIRAGPGQLSPEDLTSLAEPIGFTIDTMVPAEDPLPQAPPPAAPRPQQPGFRLALPPMTGTSQQGQASAPRMQVRQGGPSNAAEARARQRSYPASVQPPNGMKRGPGRPRLAEEDKAVPPKLVCRYCKMWHLVGADKPHTSGEGLRAHMGVVHNIVHPDMTAYKCQRCPHKFCRASDLTRHNRSSKTYEHSQTGEHWVEVKELPQTRAERADTWALKVDGPMNNALIVGRQHVPGRSDPSDRTWKDPTLQQPAS